MLIKWIIKQVAFFLTGLIYWAFAVNFYIEHQTEKYIFDNLNQVPSKKYGLVLGTSKWGRVGINPYFRFRMEAAAQLYHHHKVEKLIVSGDNHVKTYDETTDMAMYLIQLGVPDSAIIRDYAGFRTFDSVVRAQKVFHCHELIIVSQKFHNQRAIFIAHHYGIDAVAYNAQDVSSKNNFSHWREFAAKFGAFLDLFVLDRQPKFL